MAPQSDLERRVDRERHAHVETDVLTESRRLKSRFPHIETYPARVRTFKHIEDACAYATGLHVLDLGCGEGDHALGYLAAGATVEGIDLSDAYVARARALIERAGFGERASFRVMNAHRLDYPDGRFDRVVGHGILHHLDWRIALPEVRRVLRPGGRALFQEPLADNPLLRVFRWLTPRYRTEDERPFSAHDLRAIEEMQGWRVRFHVCGILSAPLAMVTSFAPRLEGNNAILRAADAVEKRWAGHRAWRSWNQYVVIELVPV